MVFRISLIPFQTHIKTPRMSYRFSCSFGLDICVDAGGWSTLNTPLMYCKLTNCTKMCNISIFSRIPVPLWGCILSGHITLQHLLFLGLGYFLLSLAYCYFDWQLCLYNPAHTFECSLQYFLFSPVARLFETEEQEVRLYKVLLKRLACEKGEMSGKAAKTSR